MGGVDEKGADYPTLLRGPWSRPQAKPYLPTILGIYRYLGWFGIRERTSQNPGIMAAAGQCVSQIRSAYLCEIVDPP